MTELGVRAEVEKIVDPETGLTLGQMKLVTDLKEQDIGVVKIDFAPTSPFCPIAFKFATDIKKAASNVEGVNKPSSIVTATPWKMPLTR